MEKIKLEEVFVLSGVPLVTFVPPVNFVALKVALRTHGRGVIVEGPSGVGKTSAVRSALHQLGINPDFFLTAREPDDLKTIEALDANSNGFYIIDDFHRLSEALQQKLADIIKINADRGGNNQKLVLIGVTNAGASLISFGHDLATRIDRFRFEANPDEKVRLIPTEGAPYLNLRFSDVESIVARSAGSFFIAQLLCYEMCIDAEIIEEAAELTDINAPIDNVVARVMERFEVVFKVDIQRFCVGVRQRAEGRAPYLRLLQWLVESGGWSLDIRGALLVHPEDKGSIGQIIQKKYVDRLFEEQPQLRAWLHFDTNNKILTVEDPRLLFYLRNLNWPRFAREIGFSRTLFPRKYDFALSFAGVDIEMAEAFYEILTATYGCNVFLANESQEEIAGRPIEDVLGPIFEYDSVAVVVIAGPEYPQRRWTQFEEGKYRGRLDQGGVVPIAFKQGGPRFTAQGKEIGAILLDRELDLGPQAERACAALASLRERLLAGGGRDGLEVSGSR